MHKNKYINLKESSVWHIKSRDSCLWNWLPAGFKTYYFVVDFLLTFKYSSDFRTVMCR